MQPHSFCKTLVHDDVHALDHVKQQQVSNLLTHLQPHSDVHAEGHPQQLDDVPVIQGLLIFHREEHRLGCRPPRARLLAACTSRRAGSLKL